MRLSPHILPLLPLVPALVACTGYHRLETIRQGVVSPEITTAGTSPLPTFRSDSFVPQDTLVFDDPEGNEVIVMKADVGENGEVMASDVITASYVTARFKNVAERGGRVDIRFQLVVPKEMIDKDWQLRFSPTMYIQEDSLMLEPVLVTGKGYRSRQLRGYEQYERFLRSIITDSTAFIRMHQLEVFLRRNLPEIYRFRNDTSWVSDAEFASHYGVTEQQAVHHYTIWVLVRRNEHRISRKDKMFRRYVKVPIITEGLRLDTVMTDASGNFVYEYVQPVKTRPKLRKVDVVLDGSIWWQDEMLYDVPRSAPLTFYISSLSTLADNTPHYLRKVITRKVEANTACYLDFASGRSSVDENLGDNRYEINRIKETLRGIMDQSRFDLDSIVVTASCSPEGSWAFNRTLSRKRSAEVSRYFSAYMKAWQDSVARNSIFSIDLSGEIHDEKPSRQDIRFLSREHPENWEVLDLLVNSDSNLSQKFKLEYASLSELDPDVRERRLQSMDEYRYLMDELYPRLRTVRFDFHLHRKGMVRDTLITTEPDTVYMAGLKALEERDYEKAAAIFKPYNDYNAAVAYCALEYNATALGILSSLEANDKVHYLMALLYSRKGDIRKAVEYYLLACEENPSYIARGNLDPEISELIRAYGLNQDLE